MSDFTHKLAIAHAVMTRGHATENSSEYHRSVPTRDDLRWAILFATGLTEAQLEGLANGTMVCVPMSKPRYSLFQIEAERSACDSMNIPYPDWADDKAHRTILAAKGGEECR